MTLLFTKQRIYYQNHGRFLIQSTQVKAEIWTSCQGSRDNKKEFKSGFKTN